jgi:hypothetical protein
MRLIHSEPLRKVIARKQIEDQQTYDIAQAHGYLLKASGDAVTTHSLVGTLTLSSSGWLMLTVPNALVRGAFDALDEPGAELPTQVTGSLNAHISVMRPEEVERIGGANKITERGHQFHYTLGPIQEAEPKTWDGISKVWFIKCISKELQDLRKSYGLSPKPNDNKFDFHITIAVRKKKVLQNNDVAKAASEKAAIGIGVIASLASLGTSMDRKKPEPTDPELELLADDKELNELRKLPVELAPTKRKRKTVPPHVVTALNSVKGANYNGMWQMSPQTVDGGAEGAVAEGTGAATSTPEDLQSEDSESIASSQEEDFDCDPAHLHGIYGYYDKSDAPAGSTTDPSPDGGVVIDSTGDEYLKTSSDVADDEEKQKRKEQAKLLTAAGVPLAGGTAAALGLMTSTSSKMPAQVTKFPGQTEPSVVRGRVSSNSPASVLENTGDAYIYAGPEDLGRSHVVANNIPELAEGIKGKLTPGQRLGLLEIQGHGAYTHQDIGNNEGPLGRISPKTVSTAADELKHLPWAPDANIIGYGCNTGICAPLPGGKPQNNWLKYLADNTGVNTWGARGYVGTQPGGLNQDVHSTHHGDPSTPRIEAGAHNRAGEDYAYTKYAPGKDPERVETQTRDTASKETFGWQPNSRLAELLYGIGKPSALAGTLATPLISDKRTARNVAAGASGLAAPMAIQEILTRFNEAQGRNAMGVGEGLSEHLKSQSKAAPYAALASLPLVTYGLANMLGRWKDKKPEKKEKPEDK